jgi:dTDP-glucose 4,6-dehydratase
MDDVSDATLKIALNGLVGESYHISTNDFISIRELVEKISEMTHVDLESLAEITGDRLGKDQAYLLATEKIRNSLGWKDKVSLSDGLADTLNWVDSNLEVLRNLPADYIHKQ